MVDYRVLDPGGTVTSRNRLQLGNIHFLVPSPRIEKKFPGLKVLGLAVFFIYIRPPPSCKKRKNADGRVKRSEDHMV